MRVGKFDPPTASQENRRSGAAPSLLPSCSNSAGLFLENLESEFWNLAKPLLQINRRQAHLRASLERLRHEDEPHAGHLVGPDLALAERPGLDDPVRHLDRRIEAGERASLAVPPFDLVCAEPQRRP